MKKSIQKRLNEYKCVRLFSDFFLLSNNKWNIYGFEFTHKVCYGLSTSGNMNNIERQLQLCPGKIENGLRDLNKFQL
jgi:hypothetical protein